MMLIGVPYPFATVMSGHNAAEAKRRSPVSYDIVASST